MIISPFLLQQSVFWIWVTLTGVIHLLMHVRHSVHFVNVRTIDAMAEAWFWHCAVYTRSPWLGLRLRVLHPQWTCVILLACSVFTIALRSLCGLWCWPCVLSYGCSAADDPMSAVNFQSCPKCSLVTGQKFLINLILMYPILVAKMLCSYVMSSCVDNIRT